MAKSPQLDHVISLIRARAAAPRKTLDDERRLYESMVGSMTLEDDIQTDRVGAGGVPAEWIWAPEAS